MIDISKYDYAVFDCDGVILDSNHLKTDAYAQSLQGEPREKIQRLVDYHIQNGGISRYAKFRLFYEQIHPQPDAETRIEVALQRFADIVRGGMIKCAYIPGVMDYIADVHRQGVPLFVASGSDEKELNEVFHVRGIDHFFRKIFGSPATKTDNTGKIVSMVGVDKKGLFFGDAGSDANAAAEFGLDFVFVKGASLWKNGEAATATRGGVTIHDFRQQAIK